MTTYHEYTGADALAFRLKLERLLQPLIAELATGYRLDSCGLQRNFDDDAIDLRIRIVPSMGVHACPHGLARNLCGDCWNEEQDAKNRATQPRFLGLGNQE